MTYSNELFPPILTAYPHVLSPLTVKPHPEGIFDVPISESAICPNPAHRPGNSPVSEFAHTNGAQAVR